jgi:hypothetical protein
METNNGYTLDSLAARITDAEEELARRRKDWYDALPPMPLSEKCPVCGCDWTDYGNLQRMEHGYERWTNGDVQEADESQGGGLYLHWSTDGWDDMSEGGDFEYVQCNAFNGGCGACFQIPEQEDWD